jgi:hypothetical protein
VPGQLSLDTFEGGAWITISPFHMAAWPRGLALMEHILDLQQLNCRTYVVFDGKPGIYFFSLDISSRLAALGARTTYRLPYYHARMKMRTDGAR